MSIGYVFLIVISGMAYFVTGIPTPDEMIANFQAAQKFYTSGAYEQALEAYIEVSEIQSRFLDEENVVVEFSQLQIPVQEASIYKAGGTYFKMVQDENRKAEEADADEDKEKARKLAIEYANKSTEYYELTQERTNIEGLKGQAQNAIINTWYEVLDYDRVIDEGEKLIERYPDSPYVLDAMYNIGWAHYDKKEYDKSIETFNQLVSRYPTAGYKSDRALFQIGESYYDQEMYAEAIPFYQQLVAKMRINELTDLEIQRIQRDKLAGITDETALDLAAKAQLKVGACFASIGDYEAGEAAYKRVATLFRFDQNLITEAYTRMADTYYDRGFFEESIGAYRDAIDEVPDKIFSAKMQILICQRYFDEDGHFEDAVREYNHYINAYSDVASRAGIDVDMSFYWLGRSYYELGNEFMRKDEREAGLDNIELALTTFERLFEQFPDTDIKSRVYFYQGLAYQRNGSEEYLNNAIVIYNKLLEDDPETPYRQYCYFFIARAYQALEDYDDAITYYRRIIEEFPLGDREQLDSAWMEMSIAYNKSNREEEALSGFLEVSRSDKKLFTTARLLSSQYLYGQGRYDEVLEVVNFAVVYPDSILDEYRLSQLFVMRGNAYKNLEKSQEAISDYTSAYDLNQPQTREMAAVYRAGVYIDIGQLATAERDLKELMNSEDEDVKRNAQMRLAVISVQQDKKEQAIQTYLDLYNSTEDPMEKLGFLRNLIQLSSISQDWAGLNKFANMMLDSEEAEGKKIENQEVFFKEESYFNLALAYEAQGDTLKARDYLKSGFAKFPNSYYSSDMLIKLGTYYLTVGQLRVEAASLGENAIDIAADYFNQFIKAFPTTDYTEMAHYYLGFCYYNGRRFDEAFNAFSSFARKYPRSDFTPEAVFYYADCKYNLGDMEESVTGFDIVISKYPRHEKAQEAYYTKAWALMDIGREEEGIEALQQLVEGYPQSTYAPHSVFSIADYYYNEQRYEEAKENYQRVLDDFPDSEVAEKVPETIKELNETIAYLEYEKGYNLFVMARENNDDPNLYRQAAEIFADVASKYPYTEAEIGSYSNLGVCYEALEMWQEAVNAYDMVIRRYEEGEIVGIDAFNFATAHKQYIVAHKF